MEAMLTATIRKPTLVTILVFAKHIVIMLIISIIPKIGCNLLSCQVSYREHVNLQVSLKMALRSIIIYK